VSSVKGKLFNTFLHKVGAYKRRNLGQKKGGRNLLLMLF
ncbi:MAG: hypothetical protein ACI8TS_002064, partial [Flavobacteriales bacterium]